MNGRNTMDDMEQDPRDDVAGRIFWTVSITAVAMIAVGFIGLLVDGTPYEPLLQRVVLCAALAFGTAAGIDFAVCKFHGKRADHTDASAS